MKQPMRNRILSFLLALLLFANNAPFSALSVGGNQESSSGSGNTAAPQLKYDYDSMFITQNGERIHSLQLRTHEKLEISASGIPEGATYQWQVEHPEKDNVWVNIYDGTQESIGVTLALVENVLRADGTARLRCRAYTEDYAYLSNAITVEILPENRLIMAAGQNIVRNSATLAEEPLEFVTVEIHYIKYEYVEHVDDRGVKSYILEETGEAYGAYVATIRNGSSLSISVPNPIIVGFDPNLVLSDGQTGATMSNDTIHINLTDVTENVSFRVEFRPAMVTYSAHYYFQNIYDDLYVENTALAPSKTLEGYTGDMPSAEVTHLAVKGFTALFYEPDIIAADGSTVFNVYYERNYYLMEFDCAGGYGADTIYVRYGTYIAVADPVRAGYAFAGWDLISTDNPDETEILADGHANPLPQTLPDYNSGYQALWNIAKTTYTVVYWRENADDCNYSYWGYKQVNANSNDHVTATSHSSLTGVDLPETAYFTYNGEMTVAEESQRTDLASDGKVIVEGDGSTVVNVYYSRNVYTLEFSIGNNTFVVPEGGHRHTDGNCEPTLLCGITNHIHGDDCISTLTCTIPEHEVHTAACVICGYKEHLHGITCLLCDQNDHTHDQTCCKLSEHVHGTSCYSLSRGSWGSAYNGTPQGTAAANGIVRTGSFNSYKFYYQIGNTWYEITGLSNNNYANVTFTQTQSCKNGHYHDDGGCDYSECTKHIHSANCYVCKKTEHIHSADCCTKIVHGSNDHTTSCYNGVGTKANSVGNSAPKNPSQGQVYLRNSNSTKYIYIGSSWYTYTGTTTSGNIAPVICHTHSDGTCAYCTDGHSHEDDCFDCGLAEHAHEDSCYRDAIHSHEDSCYTWICGDSAHTHTDECYGGCIKPENYVSGTTYYIKAKYNQTIGKLWPTAPCFTSRYLESWSISGVSNPAASKRVNMTPDLCNTATNGNKTKTVTATFSNSNTEPQKQTLFYMFESLNQNDGVNGDERRELDDVFYDSDSHYSQVVYSSSPNWAQKEIAGMTAVSGGVDYEDNNTKVFFYYKRNRYDLHFHSVNAVVDTYADLMYNSKLDTIYTDALGFASEYTPPYPSVYEPGAYVFKGWYTTPECFERTKVNWSNMKMPEGDLTLYAKWEPVNRNVYFHLTYEDISTNTYWQTTDLNGEPVTYPIVVEHGAVLGTTYHYIPQRNEDQDGDGVPDYTFIGWFYMDEENKKRFAPDTMEIKRDLHLFAEWQTTIDTEYSVTYVLKEEETINGVLYEAGTVLAVPTEGHSTAGRTKTFSAKAGDQLLAEFKTMALFPLTNTHSILMDANPTGNRYVFEYVLDPEVYYKVRYVNKVSGEVLGETADLVTANAIVTEKYKHFDGYVPDQFYIRKVLASDGGATSTIAENVITFYYLPNTENEGLYNVEFYKKNHLTGQYEQVQSEPGRGIIGKDVSISIDPNKFTGFSFTKAEVVSYRTDSSSTTTQYGSSTKTLTAKLGESGLVFRLYYDPIQYPYLIRFVDRDDHSKVLGYGMLDANGNVIMENGTPKVYTSLDAVKNAKADFDSALTYTAPDMIVSGNTVYNFLTSSSQTQTLTIRIEPNASDAASCTVNILTFYYMREVIPIEYHAVCTVPGIIGGNVSQNSDTMPQSPQGCDAMKLAGFTFEGWYLDEACTQPVPTAWLSDPLPSDGIDEKSYLKPPADGIEKGPDGKEHYYALFKPIVSHLDLQNTLNLPVASTDAFLFHVQGISGTVTGGVDLIVSFVGNGKLTLENIYCGSYTVTLLTDWSWEYGDTPTWVYTDGTTGRNEARIFVAPEGGTLTFASDHTEPDWLGGEITKTIIFDGV